MKIQIFGTLVMLLALVGCARESSKGGPGKNAPSPDNTSAPKNNRDDTFTVKVPSGATNITQGNREEVTISLNRGSNFNQSVKLKFDAPRGLKVVPSDATVKSGDNKTSVFVEAADDATVGRHTITVTAHPETGDSTSINMDIEVKKRD